MCQQATRIECLTAPSAFLWPRRGRRRRVLGGEVGVLGAGGGERGFFERPVEPLGAVAGACRSGVCRRTGRCRGTVRPSDARCLGGREDAHVDADLGDDHLGGAPLNAGDRAQQLNGRLERGDLLLDRVGEPVDLLVEEVDVREDRADPQRVHRDRSGPPAPRAARASSCAAGRAPARRAPRDRSCPATSASSIARPDTPRMSVATQSSLMPGVLERLVQPVGLALARPGSASCDSGSGCAARGSAWAARSSPAAARPRRAGTATPRRRRRSCGPGRTAAQTA